MVYDVFRPQEYASGHRDPMKQVALFLLPAGLLLVVSAPVMLSAGALRALFVAAGIAVEALGLVLLVRSDHGTKGGER
jgi:hypothetical protein